jgi:hypothetical protein
MPMLALLEKVRAFLFRGKYDDLHLLSISNLLQRIEDRLQNRIDDKLGITTNFSDRVENPDLDTIALQMQRVSKKIVRVTEDFLDDKIYRATEGGDAPTLGEWTWDDELTLEDTLSLNDSVLLPNHARGVGAILPAISSFIDVKEEDISRSIGSFIDADNGTVLHAPKRSPFAVVSAADDDDSTLTYDFTAVDEEMVKHAPMVRNDRRVTVSVPEPSRPSEKETPPEPLVLSTMTGALDKSAENRKLSTGNINLAKTSYAKVKRPQPQHGATKPALQPQKADSEMRARKENPPEPSVLSTMTGALDKSAESRKLSTGNSNLAKTPYAKVKQPQPQHGFTKLPLQPRKTDSEMRARSTDSTKGHEKRPSLASRLSSALSVSPRKSSFSSKLTSKEERPVLNLGAVSPVAPKHDAYPPQHPKQANANPKWMTNVSKSEERPAPLDGAAMNEWIKNLYSTGQKHSAKIPKNSESSQNRNRVLSSGPSVKTPSGDSFWENRIPQSLIVDHNEEDEYSLLSGLGSVLPTYDGTKGHTLEKDASLVRVFSEDDPSSRFAANSTEGRNSSRVNPQHSKPTKKWKLGGFGRRTGSKSTK